MVNKIPTDLSKTKVENRAKPSNELKRLAAETNELGQKNINFTKECLKLQGLPKHTFQVTKNKA